MILNGFINHEVINLTEKSYFSFNDAANNQLNKIMSRLP